MSFILSDGTIDDRGNVLEKEDTSGTILEQNEYLVDGVLARRTTADGNQNQTGYAVDGWGRIRQVQGAGGGEEGYTYDWKGNLAGITDEKGARIVTYSHYPDGKLKDIRHFNGVSSHYEYDTDGNISRLTTMIGDHEPLYDFRYEYDLNGNRTAKAGACLFPGEEHVRDTMISYRYDSGNRLLEEDYNGASVCYRYDLCGNRMEKESVAQRETYRYNKKNQMTERTGAKGRTFYQYDLQGNLIGESGSERGRYYYNPFNQQTKAERSDGYIQENLYDGEGLRAGINNRESSARFVFYNGELLTETKEEGGLQSRYVLGYGVAASEADGEAGYHAYHLDEQSSTVYITGNQRQVENAYAYDAFGNLRGQAGELLNRILYTGQQYDQEMGQYYLRARYYNPVLGRLMQEASYRGDGLNLYAYCDNNPVVNHDLDGKSKKKIKPGATGGAHNQVAANGGEIHHMPANNASPYGTGAGSGIRMEKEDHLQTNSWGYSKEAQAYR